MGANLYSGSAEARLVFEKADEILGLALSTLCFEGPDEDLRQTMNTQPALYVTSCAALAALVAKVDLRPFAVAGHSVGEYAALFAAGSTTFDKGLALVQKRAVLMQEAAETRPGAMAAVLGLDGNQARDACDAARDQVGGVVTVANYNCPGQIVISGTQETVERAGAMAKELGAKRVLPLPVSGGFHSPLMVGAGDSLYPYLRDAHLQNPKVPVVSNVTADYTRNGVDLAPNLTMQVSGSVRWEESMRRLLDDGVTAFFEVGSGDVLTGLMKRIDKSARTLSVQDIASVEQAAALIADMNEAQTEPNEPAEPVEPAEPSEPAHRIYHITKLDAWQASLSEGAYRPPSLEQEGFIHASRPEQIAAVANNLFRARTGLVLVEIDAARVKPEIRYERAKNGDAYPHIYGPINVDAIRRIIDFPPGPDGRFKNMQD